jgi:hypothetical protein
MERRCGGGIQTRDLIYSIGKIRVGTFSKKKRGLILQTVQWSKTAVIILEWKAVIPHRKIR